MDDRTPPLTDLPVEACISDVCVALSGPGHAVLRAPPGAGKTTVVPLRLLQQPWLAGGRIVMLEPRRLAARAAAIRMAALLDEPVGATVGYRTRDERRSGRDTRIEVVTEGILTRRLQRDPSLPGVGLVVFDEIHERNLQTDLALALTLDARRCCARSSASSPCRPRSTPLGWPPCSAAWPAPLPSSPAWVDRTLSTSGGGHRTLRERPDQTMKAAVQEALRSDDGDVLVFLAGAADIRRVASALAGSLPPDVDVRPLFGGLSPAEQDLALTSSPAGRRRVVLATDIAETSLTVAGVRIVVDSGQVRTPRYDQRTALTRLHTGPNSRASADQRSGRAGRTAPGVAHRLWSEVEHAASEPRSRPPRSSRWTWPGWRWSWPCGARPPAISPSSTPLRLVR